MTIKYKKAVDLLVSVLIFVMLICTAIPVCAADSSIDFSQKGSIYITLKHSEKPIANAQFTIYKVASIVPDGELRFEYTDEFKDFSSSTNDLSESSSPKKLIKYVNSNSITGISKSTDSNGYVNFTQLDLGLYLIAQTKTVNGYSSCSSFMVYIPYLENGIYKYDVDASPKTDVKPVTTKPTTTKQTTTKHDGFDFDGNKDSTSYLDPNDIDDTKPTGLDGNVNGDGSGNNANSSNNNGNDLYKTGQNRVLIPAIACSGLLMILIGGALLRSGQRKTND